MENKDSMLLGKTVAASKHYSPAVLYPIARQPGRELVGIQADALPFVGVDVWQSFELSWLDSRGKPMVALARFTVPCDSPNIIESKSFKLYLNSLNYTRFEHAGLLEQILRRDLGAAAGVPVGVEVMELNAAVALMPSALEGELLDSLPLCVENYSYNPNLLQRLPKGGVVSERLVSHLFRSSCPVTGQPDWASVRISYRGPAICHESLLAYLVSFRDHQEFHEQCVERIFTDVLRVLGSEASTPATLCVEAFFTRRGGLDINPVRATGQALPEALRLIRQ